MRMNILSLLLLLTFISCKEVDNNKEILEVNIYEFVSFEFNNTPLEEKYTGDIDGEPVELLKSDLTKISFIVPPLKPGRHTLNFSLGVFELDVKEATQTTAASESLNHSLDTSISDLENLALPENIYNELETLKERRDDLITIYNSFSEEEKLSVSQFLSANKSFIYDNGITSGKSTQPLLPNCEKEPTKILQIICDIQEILPKTKRAFARVVFITAISIAVGNQTGESLASWGALRGLMLNPQTLRIIKISAFAVASVATYFSLQYLSLKFELELLLLEKKVLDFFDSPELSENQGPFFNFADNIPVKATVNLAWRTLQSSDINLNADITNFINELNSLNSVISKAPSFINLFSLKFSDGKEKIIEIINGSNISIDGNPKVTFETDGDQIIFHNDSMEDEYFDLNVTIEKEGYKISKIFPAKISKGQAGCGLNGTIQERVQSCSKLPDSLRGNFSLVRRVENELDTWRDNISGKIWSLPLVNIENSIIENMSLKMALESCSSSRPQLAGIPTSWKLPTKNDFSDAVNQGIITALQLNSFYWSSGYRVIGIDYYSVWLLNAFSPNHPHLVEVSAPMDVISPTAQINTICVGD